MPKIAVNGEILHYERAGGGPPLLLVHSLGTGAWMWRGEMEYWKNRFDVIAFDARGHGESTHHGVVSIEAIADDIRGALEILGLRQVHAIGISMGGPICVRMFSADSGVLKSLVIADSFARQGEAGLQRARLIQATLERTTMADYGLAYAEGTIHRGTSREKLDKLAISIAGMDKESYIEAARSVFTADVAAAMREIDIPVAVVVGKDDTRTPPKLSEEIVELIPKAQFYMVEQAAHLSNLDNPNEFRGVIDRFFEAAVPDAPAAIVSTQHSMPSDQPAGAFKGGIS